MALTWKWDDKCGEITERMETADGVQEYTFNMYDCNGLAMWLSEWEEKGEQWHALRGFFADEAHAKKCLGLTKGYPDNIHNNWIKVKLNVAYPKMRKLANLLVKAFNDLKIELYKEEK